MLFALSFASMFLICCRSGICLLYNLYHAFDVFMILMSLMKTLLIICDMARTWCKLPGLRLSTSSLALKRSCPLNRLQCYSPVTARIFTVTNVLILRCNDASRRRSIGRHFTCFQCKGIRIVLSKSPGARHRELRVQDVTTSRPTFS